MPVKKSVCSWGEELDAGHRVSSPSFETLECVWQVSFSKPHVPLCPLLWVANPGIGIVTQ